MDNCSVYRQVYWDLSMSPYAYIPFAIWYSLIFIIGLIGNVAVIHATLKNRSLQTVQNIFIMNLAASDIVVCLLSLPITPITNIFKNWYFGSVLCRLIPWVQGVSIFICTFSMGAIAVDRYILVVRPHSTPLNKKSAISTTVVLWTLSIVVTLPYAFMMSMETYTSICGVFCTERWPNKHTRQAYTLVVMVAQFVLPFSVMAFCYTAIFSRLKSRTRIRLQRLTAHSMVLEQSTITFPASTSGEKLPSLPTGRKDGYISDLDGQTISATLERRQKEKQRLLNRIRRTTAILACMVIIFGLTWLPHNIVSLLIEYEDDDNNLFYLFGREDLNMTYLINLFTHSFAMTNNISNPLLYAWLNPTFRESLAKTFFSKRKPTKQRKNTQASLAEHKLTPPYRKTSNLPSPSISERLIQTPKNQTKSTRYLSSEQYLMLPQCNGSHKVDIDPALRSPSTAHNMLTPNSITSSSFSEHSLPTYSNSNLFYSKAENYGLVTEDGFIDPADILI